MPTRADEDVVYPVIVIVDIDDDIGEVLGKSLLVGPEEIKRAVLEYGVKRPSDPDVNALLSGLNLYEKLKQDGKEPLIVAVGGNRTDFLEAQKSIKNRILRALRIARRSGIPEFYIVSDGEDEFVISQILQDLGQIGGFRRVIVEQSLDIEGRYLLILKYVKKAMFDPRFSRYFLGIPGIALAIFSLLSLIGLASAALKTAGFIIGLAMLLRGFNLEEPLERRLSAFYHRLVEMPYVQIGALSILLLAVFASLFTAHQIVASDMSDIVKVANLSKISLPLLLAGIGTYILLAGIFDKLLKNEEGILKDVSAIVAIIFLGIAFYQLGEYILSYNISSMTLSTLVESGFIQFVISGTGLSAIIEMARRVKSRKEDKEGSVVESSF